MRSILKSLAPIIVVVSLGAQATGQKAPLPSHKDLKFAALRQIEIPEVATPTLPNGMKLYLVENHELPVISGFALVRTGNLFDPADKIGLAQMTGMVLRTGGTRSKTGEELDEQLESIAASVESGIGETSGRVSFSALSENTDEVLAVFKEVLTEPEFRQEKIDLARTRLRSAISRRNDSPGGIAAREFAEILYGRDTPYGWRMEYEHVNRIQREDLLVFYRRYFFPANIMLAVYGDFSAPEMKVKLEKLLGGWQYQQPPVPSFPKVREKASPGTHLASKEDVTQTFFSIGHLGGILRDKNYPALAGMGDILGGGFSSRLVKKVRTQLGYAYSISAAWGATYDHPGLFRVAGSTKSLSTTETLQVVREEIEKIRSEEVSDEELQTAKDTVLNSFVFNFDTPGKTLGRLVTYEYHGYPKDFIFQYQKAVAAVTKADILRVARQYLTPKNLTIVAVGKPKDFGQPLSELGMPVQPIDLTIPEPEREAAEADKESLEEGRRLLQLVQKAVGGADKLTAVKDFTSVSAAEIQAGSRSLKGKKTVRWISPAHLRQDQELPFGKIASYFDGSAGWLSTPQGTAPLQGPFLAQTQGDLFRVYFRLWLSDRDAERAVNSVGENVLEISDQHGNLVRLHVDEQSGLLLKQSYRMPGGGPPGEVEEIYSDWKEVNGIRLPQKISIQRGGQKIMDVSVEEMKLNTGLAVEEVSRQP
jgi:zinc protease